MFLQQSAQQPGGFIAFLPLIAILLVFYFIVFLPARSRQKKIDKMLKELKNGDRVITSGGIFGTIAGFRDDRVQLRVAENVKIEIARSAITALQKPEEE